MGRDTGFGLIGPIEQIEHLIGAAPKLWRADLNVKSFSESKGEVFVDLAWWRNRHELARKLGRLSLGLEIRDGEELVGYWVGEDGLAEAARILSEEAARMWARNDKDAEVEYDTDWIERYRGDAARLGYWSAILADAANEEVGVYFYDSY